MSLGEFFLLAVYDRHTDPEYSLYSHPKLAITEAKRIRQEYLDGYGIDPAEEGEDFEEKILGGEDGWWYMADVSFEGDHITVRSVECKN